MDLDPSGTGFVATLSTALTAATLWAASFGLKKFGINIGTAQSANEQAQKDMLDWQREQLASEVARREKAENSAQELLMQVNEMTKQMDRLELQNEQMKAQIEALTRTVEQFKAQMTGAAS